MPQQTDDAQVPASDGMPPAVVHSNLISQVGFTMIPNAVILDTRLSLAAKLVYGYLKHLAWRTHTTKFESPVTTLARDLGVSEKTMRNYFQELMDVALLESKRRGLGLPNLYTIHEPTAPPPEAIEAEIEDVEPEGAEDEGVEIAETSGGKNLPDGMVETSIQESKELPIPTRARSLLEEEEDQDLDSAFALTPKTDPPDPLARPSPTPRSMPRVVDRAAVTISEAGLAVKVLTAYNELTGQAYASKEWLSKIVMRIREHPELGLDEHRSVLEVALADPWWKGRPTPSVVYGNAAQFERCLDAMLAEPLRNGNGAAAQPHMKFGRRDVSATEMLAAAERLEQRKEIERESG